MAHDAFLAHDLVARLPENIEALEAWENLLAVGATSGTLILFEVAVQQATNIDPKNAIRLVKSLKGWSSKPITQLVADERHRMLVSICDGMVTLHKLQVRVRWLRVRWRIGEDEEL
jgi:hypothetical protein